jgi:thiol:disulfide interchange protein DsbC
MIKKTLLGASLSLFLLGAFVSTEAKVDDSASAEQLKTLTATLKKRFRSEPTSIQQSVMPNMYQVMYGTEVVYVSADGKYFLAGDLINMETRENLSDVAKQSVRKGILDRQDNKPVVFKAKNEKHVLQVFTDIDCPYCAKLHREVPALNEKGITIEYLMFPRAGLKSQSYTKAVSMWCADDNKQAMTDAKERKPIASKVCENPIAAQYNLGQEVGVTGTPALVTKSGKLIPGYMPADRLAAMLEADAKKEK